VVKTEENNAFVRQHRRPADVSNEDFDIIIELEGLVA
jgi:hypothetical protein